MGINKDAALEKIQKSEGTEFEVFEEKEHETFLENHNEKVIAPKVRDIYNQLDKDVKDLSGVDRNQDEKSYDYHKRVLGDYVSKVSGIAGLETTITELNKQIEAGSGDEQLKTDLQTAKKELENVQDLYRTEKEGWGKEKSDLEGSHLRSSFANEMDRSLLGIKFKEGIGEDIVKTVVDSIKNELLETAERIDGKLVFNDKEGNILRNKETAKPLTAEEIFRSRLKNIIDDGIKIEGTGVKPPTITETDVDGKKVKTVNYSPPGTVRTKDDLSKDLGEKGFVQGSEEHSIAYAKWSPDLPYK